jgi:hypothetical protein
MPKEPSTEVFYLLVLMTIIGAVILAKIFIWYRQWKSPVETSRMSQQAAYEHFSTLMSERLGVSMRAAELDRVIIECWTEWPIEYRPVLYQILRHAQLLEETMYEEAVSRKIYPRRLFEGPVIPPIHPSSGPLPEIEAVHPTPGKVVPLQRREWINGQLVAG